MTVRRAVGGRRWRAAALGACLALTAPIAALRAQRTECDAADDREVRSLTFQGNRAFTSRDLALRVATTPSNWVRRSLRVFGTRHCLDSDELRLDVGRLRAFYRRHGYYGAAVDTAVSAVEDGGVRVQFVIREGPPILIDTLRIAGLDSVTAPLAATRNLEIRQGGVFDITLLQAAIDSIKSRLRNGGYPRADVAASYSPDTLTHRAVVGLTVIPDARARLGQLHLANEGVAGHTPRLGEATLRRILPVHAGELYDAQALSDAQRTLYQSALFRKVDIRLMPDSLQPPGDTLVDVDVQLAEDYMRQVDTELGWAQVDCFKDRTHYVDKNFLGGARRLDLTAQVSKVGYASPTRISNGSLCSKLDEDPFSTKLDYYTGATMRFPTLFGLQSAPSLSVYTERRSEFKAYSRLTKIGGEASIAREVAEDLPLRLGYSLEYGHTEAQPALLCAVFRLCTSVDQQFVTQDRPLAVLSAHLDRVRVDNVLNPGSGSSFRVELRGATREFGSSAQLQFVKGLADLSLFRPVTSGITFSMRGRVGTVLGRSLSLNAAVPFVPPEERLYAGGATSVRGFGQNELGDVIYLLSEDQPPVATAHGADTVTYEVAPGAARLSQTIPEGGTSMVVLNFEARFRSPFYSELLQFSTFADAGDVWQRGLDPDRRKGSMLYLNALRWTPGVGLRVFTPVGPIQVNLAYNPFPQPAGRLYYIPQPTDAQFIAQPNQSHFTPLYCVSPGNDIPATIGASGAHEQALAECPATFSPQQPTRFRDHLKLSFSIGPDF